ncbi:hypothetical protein KJ839_06595 [Patescibacteria group bacterium]|nr:hypothetical protein [Patescibacteria group bacterium]MBU1963971.1 hypothetical protein [Patescibacteria group bacterium]
MKLIVLAAGPGKSSLDQEKRIPKCLEKFSKEATVLDSMINACQQNGVNDFSLVGGFEILKIMRKYPGVKYYYNDQWEKTGSLYSLEKSHNEFKDDVIISFSDIIYDKSTVERLIKSEKDITIAYDSEWKTRYEGRTKNILNDAVKVYRNDNDEFFITKQNLEFNTLGEFVGVVIIKRKVAEKIQDQISKMLEKNKKATLGHLVSELSKKNSVGTIDIKGKWAELDSPQDLVQFKFGTKAETLEVLEPLVEKSRVLPQISFTLDEYKKQKKEILEKIQNDLNSSKLVIRSSALNEDTENSSMAGNYESVLNVDRTEMDQIENAILRVAKSYLKDNQKELADNQILVQPQIEGVKLSGVAFTKDLETSAPYYIINYDITARTDTITSGDTQKSNTFIYFKFSDVKPDDPSLIKIIQSLTELEELTGHDSLDVEFAIAKNEIYIFQVRPIAAQKESIKVFNRDISAELDFIKERIRKYDRPAPKLAGKRTAYGIMPDWNPAEIIGVNPNPLAFSLYKYIITDSIWGESRKLAGYRDAHYTPGIISFAGKPYVDIRMSFNSFTPAEISEQTADKLIDHYIDKLKKNPELHDKVEFLVAITAYDLEFDEKMEIIIRSGFSESETNEIRNAFRNLTNNIINEKNILIDNEIQKTEILTGHREKIFNSNIPLEDKIIKLLEDCKTYGTLPFSILARYSFIGSILMKSLLKKEIISQQEYDAFYTSISTVAKDFINNLSALSKGNMEEKEFLNAYGHLRPGTYDISKKTYNENFNEYMDLSRKIEGEKIEDFKFNKQTLDNIDTELKKHKLDFNAQKLLDFVRKATEAREYIKFEFTKNLSLVLDLISELMSEFGISRNDAAYLSINDIISIADTSRSINLENELHNKIKNNKEKHLITSAIKLPEVIFNEDHVDYFFVPRSQPNFITQKNISGEIIFLENETADIEGKIVMIENADPGFDWIFSHNIKGLITKYGGVASHMSIRCAEFGLPAAIGCGDLIFNEVKELKKVNLDCKNNRLEGII